MTPGHNADQCLSSAVTSNERPAGVSLTRVLPALIDVPCTEHVPGDLVPVSRLIPAVLIAYDGDVHLLESVRCGAPLRLGPPAHDRRNAPCEIVGGARDAGGASEAGGGVDVHGLVKEDEGDVIVNGGATVGVMHYDLLDIQFNCLHLRRRPDVLLIH